MPLTEAREPFIFVDLPELSFKRLPAIMADETGHEIQLLRKNTWS
jgi:hypothetical protein